MHMSCTSNNDCLKISSLVLGDTFTASSKGSGRLTARGEELRMLAASQRWCPAWTLNSELCWGEVK